MRTATALACAILLAGCAGPQRPPGAGPRDDAQLQALHGTRAELAAQVEQLASELIRFQEAHSDLEQMRELSRQNAMQVSESLVAAQLETIDLKSKYAPGHPALQSAQKREAELYGVYQQSIKKMHDFNKLVLERDRIVDGLGEKRDALRRLDDRIARLEDRRA